MPPHVRSLFKTKGVFQIIQTINKWVLKSGHFEMTASDLVTLIWLGILSVFFFLAQLACLLCSAN